MVWQISRGGYPRATFARGVWGAFCAGKILDGDMLLIVCRLLVRAERIRASWSAEELRRWERWIRRAWMAPTIEPIASEHEQIEDYGQ
jgi:hypothetical protein